jgi:hypothetical protein
VPDSLSVHSTRAKSFSFFTSFTGLPNVRRAISGERARGLGVLTSRHPGYTGSVRVTAWTGAICYLRPRHQAKPLKRHAATPLQDR